MHQVVQDENLDRVAVLGLIQHLDAIIVGLPQAIAPQRAMRTSQ